MDNERYYRAKKLVEMDVILCASQMIDGLLKIPYDARTEDLRAVFDPDFASPNDCENLVYGPEDENADYTDILEHWIVGNRLAKKLKEHGEVVAELWNMQIWGRSTSGQMIAVDDVIQDIAEELEISP